MFLSMHPVFTHLTSIVMLCVNFTNCEYHLKVELYKLIYNYSCIMVLGTVCKNVANSVDWIGFRVHTLSNMTFFSVFLATFPTLALRKRRNIYILSQSSNLNLPEFIQRNKLLWVSCNQYDPSQTIPMTF